MAPKKFKVGDLVWAKRKGFPMWPGKIDSNPKRKKGHHFVYFFGTYKKAWVLDEHLTAHSKKMFKRSEKYKKRPKGLDTAIEEIKKQEIKLANSTESNPIREPSPIPLYLPLPENWKPQKTTKTPLQKVLPKRLSNSKDSRGPLRKRVKNGSIEQPFEPYVEEVLCSDNYAHNGTKISSRSDVEVRGHSLGNCSTTDDFCLPGPDELPYCYGLKKLAIIPPMIKKPEPEVQLPSFIHHAVVGTSTQESGAAKMGVVEITTKKIGIIGLGIMGQGLVKNLIDTKHDVTVWNRTKERCAPFVAAGAKQVESLYDVSQNCDIIFCCISDTEALKGMLFQGILKAFKGIPRGSKGFVMMSSIDPDTSQSFCKMINQRGGRYLEALVVGQRKLSEEGSLVLIGSGDRELFNDCGSCLSAITKSAFYIGSTIGLASKMKIVASMVTGSAIATMAEAICMLEHLKLPFSNFLDILKGGQHHSPLLIDKAQRMLESEFKTSTPLQHQQTDLNLALLEGNQIDQPLLVAAAAHEMYKRANMLKKGEEDSAAVIFGARVHSEKD